MMDCREALAQLGDLSVQGIPPRLANEIMSHLQECPECEDEWVAFQETLFIASTTAQPLPTPEQTQQIWNACLEKIIAENERERTKARNPFLGWFDFQPRLGWAALGGAVAVFGGVWLLAPQADVPQDSSAVPQFVRFENPPESMAALVNNHTAMAVDPFNDHVGSTLVSYSATAK
jgi:hypothetical protein